MTERVSEARWRGVCAEPGPHDGRRGRLDANNLEGKADAQICEGLGPIRARAGGGWSAGADGLRVRPRGREPSAHGRLLGSRACHAAAIDRAGARARGSRSPTRVRRAGGAPAARARAVRRRVRSQRRQRHGGRGLGDAARADGRERLPRQAAGAGRGLAKCAALCARRHVRALPRCKRIDVRVQHGHGLAAGVARR